MKRILLLLYYCVLQHLPMDPFPGGRLCTRIRSLAAKCLLLSCGRGVIIRSGCYFGDGSRLAVGDGSELGRNARLNGTILIGNDVLMAPDVVMMATTHRHDRTDIPIRHQGEGQEKPIRIGDGAWIGTRVVILPGVEIGHNSIVAAGAVVTRSCKPFSIIGGVPARVLKRRTAVSNGKA